jgi:carbon starvation protein
MLGRESRIRDIGYGAMITEMMVALMAMIAACVLEPGQYFAINSKGAPTEVVARVSSAGFPVTKARWRRWRTIWEATMFNRAVVVCRHFRPWAWHICASLRRPHSNGALVSLAIMFEALLYLTTSMQAHASGAFSRRIC